MKHSSVQYCPVPVVLPIVFVPGLMGSRLRTKHDGQIVWDPQDNKVNAATIAFKGAKAKRDLLVNEGGLPYSPDYLEVDFGETQSSHAMHQEQIERGWGGLMQGSYFNFITWLQLIAPHPASGQLPPGCFSLQYEVWAHPYNWTDDNFNAGKTLADTVQKAIDGTHEKYQGRNTRVLKPIIITHSMGGLVSRAYTQLHGGEGEVHGVIHGAQPCDGAPDAYKRMLAGSEGMARFVLGANQAQVTATAGNMPGVLQLLPNQWHKTVAGDTRWLKVTGPLGETLLSKPDNNPYSDVYLNQTDWWRLIYAEYLNPESKDLDKTFKAYTEELLKAATFHAQLGPEVFHPNTRMLYADDTGHPSWDHVEWKQIYGEDDHTDRNNWSRGTFSATLGRGQIEISKSVQDPLYDVQGLHELLSIYKIQPANAPGDGTVHAGSGIHVSGPMSIATQRGFEHQSCFDSSEARRITAEWLLDMVQEQL
ncbi:PGAP1-like alpha/beta domain-containing protein [Nitrincola iocasae]|uniref:Alpha/beta fold hydrolase n=1 Tax=Nitrincola iocasae TaxID=2614693 RepID=A0A5J6LI62_9GAMM|nr:alpha/beta fold hydrolase [Nitrincola iocasae]QEW08327.1 alpha/beta fold hydrolase [Nitrincola iocasae]